VQLTIETGGPARIEVHGPDHKLHQPEGSLMDRSVGNRPGAILPGPFRFHWICGPEPPCRPPHCSRQRKGWNFERLETNVDPEADRTQRLLPWKSSL
jgi:hypothetical protein